MPASARKRPPQDAQQARQDAQQPNGGPVVLPLSGGIAGAARPLEGAETAEGQAPAGFDRRRGGDLLVLAVAAGRSIVQAAQEAGVSERTARRRVKEHAFIVRVAQVRGALLDRVAGQLVDGMSEAVGVLRDLMKSRAGWLRFAAACRVLELGERAGRRAEYTRLLEVEAALEAEGKLPRRELPR